MSKKHKALNFADKDILKDALKESFRKLNIKVQLQNQVMFIVYLGSIFTSVLFVMSLFGAYEENFFFVFSISLILWFTVLFANFAEAIAEGRAKAQANSLKDLKKTTDAFKVVAGEDLSLIHI